MTDKAEIVLTDAEREQRCRREQISHEHYAREDVERIVAARVIATVQAVAEGFGCHCEPGSCFGADENGNDGDCRACLALDPERGCPVADFDPRDPTAMSSPGECLDCYGGEDVCTDCPAAPEPSNPPGQTP